MTCGGIENARAEIISLITEIRDDIGAVGIALADCHATTNSILCETRERQDAFLASGAWRELVAACERSLSCQERSARCETLATNLERAK